MPIVDTLAPIVLLLGLGAMLARLRFLGAAFIADLNKLAFWVALPSLLFRSAAHASTVEGHAWLLVGLMIAATLIIAAAGWAASVALGLPPSARGTLVQSVFRGNLAYIGVPVVTYSLAATGAEQSPLMATAVIVMSFTMAFYNVLAVIVLQASRPRAARFDVAGLVVPIATNPLLLSGLGGLAASYLRLPIPDVFDAVLKTLGDTAVPIALLCIGGSLAMTPLAGRRVWIVTAALMKVALLPIVAWALCRAAGLTLVEQRIALVYSSAPTAAAAYIMARQMDGDEALASGSIAVSTILSPLSLGVALWMTRG
jgi:predicted permease